ncbi:hypothetical protein TNCV_4406861 [Trichonephila clavipes]|nr:hypothetical protein TNCV_4406861 [Trichonephila clavipes]
MRGRIIGKIEEGRKITDVARKFDIAHSVVSRLWNTVLPVCNGVVRITIGLNRTGHAYYSQKSRFSLSSDCRRQLIWRESGTAYRPENIQERTDIRHAVPWCGPASDQWPHAPTCGCEWDYDGPTIH